LLPLSVVSPRFHLSYLARCQRQRVRQSCCRRGEPRPLLLPRCRRRNAVAGITFVAAGDASRCRSASCYCAYSCPCCRRANCRFKEERRRHRRGRGLGHPARVRAEGRRHGESRAKIKRKMKKMKKWKSKKHISKTPPKLPLAFLNPARLAQQRSRYALFDHAGVCSAQPKGNQSPRSAGVARRR